MPVDHLTFLPTCVAWRAGWWEPRRYKAEEPAEGTVLYTGSQGGTEQRRHQKVQYYQQGAKEVQSREASRRYSIIYREPWRYRAEEKVEGTVLYRVIHGGKEQRSQQKVQYYIEGAKEVQTRGVNRRYSIINREPRKYRAEEPAEGTVYIQGAKEVQSRGASRTYSIINREPRRYRAEEPKEGTVLYTWTQGGTVQRSQQKVQYYIQGANEVQNRGASRRYSII
jgi:hypothetical protein